MKMVSTFVLTLSTLLGLPILSQGASPDRSAVRISVGIYAGSGSVIGSEPGKALVLTNAHVVEARYGRDGSRITVSQRDSSGQVKHYPAKWLAGAEVVQIRADQIDILGPDVCLLEVDTGDDSLQTSKITEEVPAVGSEVTQYGFGGNFGRPVTYYPTRKVGQVVYNNPNDFREGTTYTTVKSESGDSGSGVFNAKGELCCLTAGQDHTRVYHRAVDIVTVQKFTVVTLSLKGKFRKLLNRLQSRPLLKALVAKLRGKVKNPTPTAPPKADNKAPAPKPVPDKKAEPKKVDAPKKAAGPLSYPAGYTAALKDNKPLVVFVTCPNVRPIPGAVIAQGSMMLPLPPGTGIVVLKPNGKGQMVVTQCLRGCASDAVLAAEVAKASK